MSSRDYKKYQSGFLTMEVLLAMAVMIFAVSAAVLMCFGGQFFTADAAQNSEALDLAQRMLWCQRDLALNDFRLVNATSTQEGIFNAKVEVSPHSFFVKKVNASVDFNIGNRPQKVELETLIADYNNTAGNDTCDSNLTGDWKNPQIKKVINFSEFAEDALSSYAIGAVDAYKEKLYVAVAKTGRKTDSTFFVFDISNPLLPMFLNKTDNAPTTIDGFSALAVDKNYAYLANNHQSNFGTCSQNYNCAQLQIIDLNLMAITNFKLPGVTDDGGRGNSIFYRADYIYLGLAKTEGLEFNIIDVKNPANPFFVGGFEIGAGINDIYVKGDYAYLAHPADLASPYESGREQLTILNVSNPANPYRIGGFYHQDSMGGNGKSLHVIGDKIYLGRTTSHISGAADAIPEFFILDNPNPEMELPSVSGFLVLPAVDSVNGVRVRDYLGVLLGRSDLRIINIGDPVNIFDWASLNFGTSPGEYYEPSFDCQGNYFFVGHNNENKGFLSIITAK